MVKIERLTVKEVAELKGCSEQYIKKLISANRIKADEVISDVNKRKMYVIEVKDLPSDLQSKYYQQQVNQQASNGVETIKKISKKVKTKNREYKDLDDFTASERKVIDLWRGVIGEWKEHRKEYDNMLEADEVFVTLKKHYFKLNKIEENISRGILYKKAECLKDGYYQGLIDERGKHSKGKTTVTEEMQQVFNTYYLNQYQYSVAQAYRFTTWYFEIENPQLLEKMPSERAFRRYKDTLPASMVIYMREGAKAFYDKASVHISRSYENLEANECWIADGHTFDVITKERGTEKKHRLTLTAFMDAKTGVMVGWHISDNPCSQATVLALRHAILRFGKPKYIYCDNGREYLTYDLGGKGHRKRKNKDYLEIPPNIFERLGIEMINAIVANARAKNIERAFDTVKNYISRTTPTFTGGTILERPECHKYVIKNDDIMYDDEFKEKVNQMLDGIYNVDPYGGYESKFKGMTRIQVWNEEIKKTNFVRVSEENLNLLLMRSSKIQKVSRATVSITIFGKEWKYTSEELWHYHNKEVYIRVDPDKPQIARLYNKDDQYMFDVQSADMLRVDFIEKDKEKVAQGMKEIRRVEKAVKKAGAEAILSPSDRIDALNLSIKKSMSNIEEGKFEIIKPAGTEYELTDKEQSLSEVMGFDGLRYVTKDGEILNV